MLGIRQAGEQSAQVIFERAVDTFDGMEFAATSTGTTLVEKGSTFVAILLPREVGEVFLGQRSWGGLRIALRQTLEANRIFSDTVPRTWCSR